MGLLTAAIPHAIMALAFDYLFGASFTLRSIKGKRP